MPLRALIFTGCLLLTAWYLSLAPRAEAVPAHAQIESLPLAFDGWIGGNTEPFSPQILAILGVDHYVSRHYRRSTEPRVGLYIGFYESQRQGDTMHSPLNCLPGAGWIPISKRTATITAFDGARKANRDLVVNRIIIEKGLDRQLVLYWYQSHGRVVASEYWGKIYTVVDAVRMNRTDAALVRIIAPLGDDPGGSEPQAEARAVSFVQALFPQLSQYLPQ
jgi:EpsI family protein